MHLNTLHNADSDYKLADSFTNSPFPSSSSIPNALVYKWEHFRNWGSGKLITIIDLENNTFRNDSLFVSCESERGSQEIVSSRCFHLNITLANWSKLWEMFLIQLWQCGDGNLIIPGFLILVYSRVLEPNRIGLWEPTVKFLGILQAGFKHNCY